MLPSGAKARQVCFTAQYKILRFPKFLKCNLPACADVAWACSHCPERTGLQGTSINTKTLTIAVVTKSLVSDPKGSRLLAAPVKQWQVNCKSGRVMSHIHHGSWQVVGSFDCPLETCGYGGVFFSSNAQWLWCRYRWMCLCLGDLMWVVPAEAHRSLWRLRLPHCWAVKT